MKFRRPYRKAAQASPMLATVRDARQSDLAEVAVLDAAINGGEAEPVQNWRVLRERRDHGIFVAEHGGCVVGFALLRFRCDRIAIETVTVNSGYRRRGIGRQLAHRAIHEADGCWLAAVVCERNVIGQFFLASLGFVCAEILERPGVEDRDYSFLRQPVPAAAKQATCAVP